jgi:hypothetical protein
MKKLTALLLVGLSIPFVRATDAPGPVTSLTIRKETPELEWSALEGAESYDVVGGGLDALRSSGGSFTAAVRGCVTSGASVTWAVFPETPGPGQGFWVLVRGDNVAGAGTYDDAGTGQAGSRDAAIAAAAFSCGHQAECGDGVCNGEESCQSCPSDCGTCACTVDAECQPASCCNPTSCITIWEPQSCGGACSDGCWICLSACLCNGGQCQAVF